MSVREVGTVDRLDVDVRFGAVPAITTGRNHLPCSHLLTDTDAQAPLSKVAHRDDRPRRRPNQDVITGQRSPAGRGSPPLREGITNRGQPTVSGVIGLGVVGGDDLPRDGREMGARSGRPKPGNLRGSSARNQLVRRIGAVRPASVTGTKSMAYALAKAVVPWLGTRLPGEFCTSHEPVNG